MKRRSYYLFHCIYIENTSMVDSIKGVPFIFYSQYALPYTKKELKTFWLVQPQSKSLLSRRVSSKDSL